MSVFESLARELEEDPAKRHALRALLLTEELLALPTTVAALAAGVKELTARVDELTARVDKLTAQVGALTARVDELTETMRGALVRLDHLETDVSVLKTDVSVLKTDVGSLKGSDLERRWRRNLPSYLGQHFRRLRVIDPRELRDLLDDAAEAGRITAEEANDAALADAVARGRPREDGAEGEVYLVVEVSVAVDAADLDRASRRAIVVGRATGASVQAVAAGLRTTEGASVDAASRRDVMLVLAGHEAA
ncbi:MAG: hypothetical protein ACRDZQ_11050 [Acidimicrobiales bacterium]